MVHQCANKSQYTQAMLNVAYFEADTSDFCNADEYAVLGELAQNHVFSLEADQKYAWQQQIQILQSALLSLPKGKIYFEFSIPRMGKRADTVLVTSGIVFVIEFKVGSENFDLSGIEQVHDYALDLKNFHRGSHSVPIVPILIATRANKHPTPALLWADDGVASPLCSTSEYLAELIQEVISQKPSTAINADAWASSGYFPTPTIVEAAQALYRDHDVKDIARSDADAKNLGRTTDRIGEIIEKAKNEKRKSICFVTGVPGAGKTLAGLNIATSRARTHSDEHAVFLSGNGPLVDVMREALARDQSEREGVSKKVSQRKVAGFVQNIHHFRDQALREPNAPAERVVVFDEAQRAWDRHQASKFMRQKRQQPEFEMSEPEFLVGVMDRHEGWCVVICLIGGGQEINTGEAGLAEWIKVMGRNFKHWDVHLSSRIDDRDYIWDQETEDALKSISIIKDEALHLGVSMRSFRAESLSEFIGHVVENRPDDANKTFAKISEHYPIYITRELDHARQWLRDMARGSERYGLVASSGANRLRPEGITMKAKVEAPLWFLNSKTDVRSSYYLEEVASEFDVQGLELDWTGVCWDADYMYANAKWQHQSFKGTRWQQVRAPENQLYLKNAYRVILTRARQGMVIFVPKGSISDPTRPPEFYDQTFNYLISCGIKTLEPKPEV